MPNKWLHRFSYIQVLLVPGRRQVLSGSLLRRHKHCIMTQKSGTGAPCISRQPLVHKHVYSGPTDSAPTVSTGSTDVGGSESLALSR